MVKHNITKNIPTRLLSMAVLGFEPYQGDRVEVEFSTQSDTLGRRALLVKPLRHKHVHEVVRLHVALVVCFCFSSH